MEQPSPLAYTPKIEHIPTLYTIITFIKPFEHLHRIMRDALCA